MDARGRGEFRRWHGLKELNYNKPKHGASVWWLGGEKKTKKQWQRSSVSCANWWTLGEGADIRRVLAEQEGFAAVCRQTSWKRTNITPPRKYITRNVFCFVIKLHNVLSIRRSRTLLAWRHHKCEFCLMKTINPAMDPRVSSRHLLITLLLINDAILFS